MYVCIIEVEKRELLCVLITRTLCFTVFCRINDECHFIEGTYYKIFPILVLEFQTLKNTEITPITQKY